jgi:hypothetical protein
LIVLVAIPIITPAIPPFIGYLICVTADDFLGVSDKFCGQPSNGRDTLWIPELSETPIIIHGLRLLGGLISLVTYVPALRSALFICVFEIIPSLTFFKDTSSQFLDEVGGNHNNIRYRAQPDVTLRKYKEFQLLISMFNDIYQTNFFVNVMACGVFIIVSSGFFLISTHHVDNLPVVTLLLLPITLTAYAIVILIFSLASKVWSNSLEFKSAWTRNHQMGNKWSSLSRKEQKSIQNLKIKVGACNFIEKNTPFILVSFCIEQTVSLLLVKG